MEDFKGLPTVFLLHTVCWSVITCWFSLSNYLFYLTFAKIEYCLPMKRVLPEIQIWTFITIRAEENPHAVIELQQHPLKVWIGIVCDDLIVLHFLLPLKWSSVLSFLKLVLPLLLQNVPLEVREALCLMYDGPTRHVSILIRQFQDGTYGKNRIGRKGLQWLPPRSQDLNLLVLFLWGHSKGFMLSDKTYLGNMSACLINDVKTLRCLNLKIEGSCIKVEGWHFEQLS